MGAKKVTTGPSLESYVDCWLLSTSTEYGRAVIENRRLLTDGKSFNETLTGIKALFSVDISVTLTLRTEGGE
jgi:hypothetical protein